MLDKKKLNSIARKLNISINFDSDTPGITLDTEEGKQVTSFDTLVGFFEKDNRIDDIHYSQYIVTKKSISSLITEELKNYVNSKNINLCHSKVNYFSVKYFDTKNSKIDCKLEFNREYSNVKNNSLVENAVENYTFKNKYTPDDFSNEFNEYLGAA